MTAFEWWEQLNNPVALDVENDWNIECGTNTARGCVLESTANVIRNAGKKPTGVLVALTRPTHALTRDLGHDHCSLLRSTSVDAHFAVN